jgi:hypothetical protein
VIGCSAYHRSCFRCRRCSLHLTPGNYYEAENGQYCCEACPVDEVPVMMLLEASLSDAEISNRHNLECEQQQAASRKQNVQVEEEDADGKFDKMIKIISNKMDKLTNENKRPEEQIKYPDAKQRHDSCDNSTPVEELCRKASDKEGSEISKKRVTSVLRRTSSLRSSNEHITENLNVAKEISRRFSLVQHRLNIFEPESKLTSEFEPEIETLSQTRNQQFQKFSPTPKDDYPEDLNPFISSDEDTEVSSKRDLKSKERSTNPFDSTDEETMSEEIKQTLKPITRSKSRETTKTPIKRVLEAPQLNLNPFWSDDEEHQSSPDCKLKSRSKSPPIPKPRTIRSLSLFTLLELFTSFHYRTSISSN